MDAPEDGEIRLQKSSSDLLRECTQLLPSVLYNEHEKRGASDPVTPLPRARVRSRDVDKLIRLIEPFQEWPQLLDPHLSKFLPMIVSAFSESLMRRQDQREGPPSSTSLGTIPFHEGACKLLYTFCKVRGANVVSRFFQNDPRYLERLMSSFEDWTQSSSKGASENTPSDDSLSWEGRYIVLLWLSHLMLAPFDLASMSSMEPRLDTEAFRKQLQIPQDVPDIAARLATFGFMFIDSPSKERESAVALLIRLTVRHDMLRLGLMESLVIYTTKGLGSESALSMSTYSHVGHLSFLGRLLATADHTSISPYISPIFHLARELLDNTNALAGKVKSSALARKWLLKICRGATVQSLSQAGGGPSSASSAEILEESIDKMLTALADADSPVRYAASKALATISAKLEPDVASEVVDAVIDSMDEDVLWVDASTGKQVTPVERRDNPNLTVDRDLSRVNPLRWHGLTLTLSHMLFRRTSTPEQLPGVINALVPALEFEQRSSTMKTTGTNIRDAACFGIWALSRKYTTKELSRVDTAEILAARRSSGTISALQLLANELVTSACLDPAGNIRRGASAALQEMIGRHPDAIECGIALVQVVDYHAVALRPRAMMDVSSGAAKLHDVYWDAVSSNIVSWRGLHSSDAESRRAAAKTIGILHHLRCQKANECGGLLQTLEDLAGSFCRLQERDVEERHGFLLALAALLGSLLDLASSQQAFIKPFEVFRALNTTLSVMLSLKEAAFTSSVLRPDLTAEATCQLMTSAMRLLSGFEAGNGGVTIDATLRSKLVTRCVDLLPLALSRKEKLVLEVSSLAAQEAFGVLDDENRKVTMQTYVKQLQKFRANSSFGASGGLGYISALGSVFQLLGTKTRPEGGRTQVSPEQATAISTLIAIVAESDVIETRVAAMRSLTNGVIAREFMTPEIVTVIALSLDDYTIESRGDVGSWLRLAAVDAVESASRKGMLRRKNGETFPAEILLPRIIRLTAEQLDKVRFAAWTCLKNTLERDYQHNFKRPFDHFSQTSSPLYFSQILSLCSCQFRWTTVDLLDGFVASAGGGSESVLRASRRALADFAESLVLQSSPDETLTLLEFGDALVEVLRRNISDERKLVHCIEVIAFLLDVGILQKLISTEFKWRTLLSLIQKSHFKSGNMHKVAAAIKVYGGLCDVPVVRQDAVKKLSSMLLHPFFLIRNAAAECLYVACEEQLAAGTLQDTNWSTNVQNLTERVEVIKSRLLASA